MEALYLRNPDQMFPVWGYVKLQTEAHFMFILKKKSIYHQIALSFLRISGAQHVWNQAGFIEELKFGLSNLILVSEVWV